MLQDKRGEEARERKERVGFFPSNEGEEKSRSGPRGSEVPLCRFLASPMRHSPPNLGKHRDDWLTDSQRTTIIIFKNGWESL